MIIRILAALAVLAMSLGPAMAGIKAHRTGINAGPTPLNVARLGDLSVQGGEDPERLAWRGRTIAKLDTYRTVKIVAAFPSKAKPSLVLLEAWNGGAVCHSDLIVIDMLRVPPVAMEAVYGCEVLEYLWTGEQLIVQDMLDRVSVYRPGIPPIIDDETPDEARATRGAAAFERGDFAAAVRNLWPIRDRRWSAAPYLLGKMSAMGRGLPKSLSWARAYFETAVDLGSADAAEALARMHAQGQGGAKNATLAVEYRRMATRLRQSPAGDPFADPQSWRRWVGEWPFERFQGRNLFEVEAIAARLRALLAEDEIAALKRKFTSREVEVTGNWLHAAGCVPHECTTYLYGAYFELVPNGRAVVCLYADLPAYMERRDVVAASGLGTLRRQVRDSLEAGFLCDAWSDDPMKMAEPLVDPRVPPRRYLDPRR